MQDQPTPNETEPSITLEGITYPVSKLSSEVQNLIGIYQKWEKELDQARLEVFKLEGAIKAVGYEIQTRINTKTDNPGPR